MSLFGNLFEKKTCAFCGKSIGLLGNRKLVDGNMCKECAAKLSPYFSDRKESTVAEIGEQLEYRRTNKEALKDFTVTRKLGYHGKIYIDDNHGKFFVTSATNYMAENPDIIDFSAVSSCDIEIPESKMEIRYYDAEHMMRSFRPEQYDYSYNFYMDIYVSHPYISNLRFRLNSAPVEIKNMMAHDEKDRLDAISERIRREQREAKAEEGQAKPARAKPRPQKPAASRPQPQPQNVARNPKRVSAPVHTPRPAANPDDTMPRQLPPFEFDPETYPEYAEYANLACAVKFAVDNMTTEEGITATEYYVECPNCGKITASSKGTCQFCGLEIVL